MFQPGHVGMVLLLYSMVGYWLVSRRYEYHAVGGGFLVLAFATIPDIDTSIAWLPHRGPTHTVLFALLVGVVVSSVIVLDSIRRRFELETTVTIATWGGGLATFSVLVHLLADALNPMGIRPFAPISDFHLSLDLVWAGEPFANFGLLLAGVLATTAGWHLSVERSAHDVPRLPVLLAGMYWGLRDGALPEQGGLVENSSSGENASDEGESVT